jgi:uncharacterized membrane protein
MSSDSRLPRLIFLALVVAAALQCAYYYPLLAGRLASHFDGAGSPNGWQTKGVFFGFYVGGIVVTSVLIFGIPKLIAVVPDSVINLPNKAYWLAPGRRAETVGFFEAQFAWFGVATFFVMLSAVELAIRANLAPDAGFSSSAMWCVLGGYFAFVLLWLVRLIGRFARTP